MGSIRLSDLRPWDRNYNQGDVGAIYQSIAAFGFNGTLRVWRDGIVVAGNHALKALQGMKQAGELPPEHVEVDADGEWLIPVTMVTHLDRTQAQAFAIADNRTRDLAQSDDALLAGLLQEIANEDAALLDATGYDEDDLDTLLRDITDDVWAEAFDPTARGEPDASQWAFKLDADQRGIVQAALDHAREITAAEVNYWSVALVYVAQEYCDRHGIR